MTSNHLRFRTRVQLARHRYLGPCPTSSRSKHFSTIYHPGYANSMTVFEGFCIMWQAEHKHHRITRRSRRRINLPLLPFFLLQPAPPVVSFRLLRKYLQQRQRRIYKGPRNHLVLCKPGLVFLSQTRPYFLSISVDIQKRTPSIERPSCYNISPYIRPWVLLNCSGLWI